MHKRLSHISILYTAYHILSNFRLVGRGGVGGTCCSYSLPIDSICRWSKSKSVCTYHATYCVLTTAPIVGYIQNGPSMTWVVLARTPHPSIALRVVMTTLANPRQVVSYPGHDIQAHAYLVHMCAAI